MEKLSMYMEEAEKMLTRKQKKEATKKEKMQKDELLKELEATKNAIATAYANLSYVIEPELIDCCIYELNAFQLRYKFILSQVKDCEALSYTEKLSK